MNDRTMCDNCGYESDDVTTYHFSPKFKMGWDGVERLVFPHVNICSDCQKQPFRKLDSGHTVSSITGQVLWDNGEKNPGPESFEGGRAVSATTHGRAALSGGTGG